MHETYATLHVPGEPIPQGSKKHVGKGVMIESNKKIRPWRAMVSDCADDYKRNNPTLMLPMCGPIRADISFCFSRPPSVKRVHHITKPDIDKLTRAVLDSLKGRLIVDDSMINELTVSKSYGEPGVIVTLAGSPYGTRPALLKSTGRSGRSARDAG